MKKRIAAVLLTLILLPYLCCQGFASDSISKILFQEEEKITLLGNNEDILDVANIGENLYILFDNQLFRYSLGEEQPSLMPDFSTKENSLKIINLLVWNEILYGLEVNKGEMIPISKDTGSLFHDQKLVFPRQTDTQEEPLSKAFYPQDIAGNELYFIEQNDEGGHRTQLFSINLETLEKEQYQVENLQKVINYKDGNLLGIYYKDAWLNSPDAAASQEKPSLVLFTPQNDQLQPLYQWDELNVGGIAYDPSSGYIYYVIDNQIYRQTEKGSPEEVSYITNTLGTFSQKAWVTAQGVYILWGGWNDGIIIKDTVNLNESAVFLSLNGYLNESVEKSFQKKHPDVLLESNFPVMEGYPTTADIAFAIQTGGTQMDILFAYAETHDFKLLAEKGYISPITSPIVCDAVAKMHPYIQQHVTINEQVYGIPTDNFLPTTQFSYSPSIWQEAGLSDEKVPATYLELFTLAAEKKDEIEKNHPGMLFWGPGLQSRENLIRLIGSQTINYYQKQGETVNFDTPTFRKLLELIDKIGIEEEPVYEGDSPPSLFFYSSLSEAYTQEHDQIPLFLSLDEGMEPAYPVTANIAFINATSNNKEVATAFLEEIVQGYTPEEHIRLFAGDHNPVMSDAYTIGINDGQINLAELTKQLEEAPEAEKAEIQEQITVAEQYLQNMENYFPQITKESIQRYQDHITDFYIPSGPALPDGGGNNSVWLKLKEYIDYEISLEDFIRESGQMAKMIYYENQ